MYIHVYAMQDVPVPRMRYREFKVLYTYMYISIYKMSIIK